MERSNSSNPSGHSFLPSGLTKTISSIANSPKKVASATSSPKSSGFIPSSPQDANKNKSKHSIGEAAIGCRSKLAPRPTNLTTSNPNLKVKVSMTVSDDPQENFNDIKTILINIFTEIEAHWRNADESDAKADNFKNFRLAQSSFQSSLNQLFNRLKMNVQQIRKQIDDEQIEVPDSFVALERDCTEAFAEFTKNADMTDRDSFWTDTLSKALHSLQDNVIVVEEFFFPKDAPAPVLAPCTFTQRIPRKFMRVVEKSDSFIVDPSNITLESAELVELNHEFFANDILPNQCYHYMCAKDGEYIGFISIQHVATSSFPGVTSCFNFDAVHNAIFVDKFGCSRLTIPHRDLLQTVKEQGNRKFVSKALVEKFLQTYAQTGIKIHKINMPTFPQEMSELCSFHGDAIRAFKIAVLYVKPGDKSMPEIFANKPPVHSKFYTFLDAFAEKISMKNWKNYRGDIGKEGYDAEMDSYYTQWKNCQVMLHVAPMMIPEQHRRLIGNDICVIIFYEHSDDKYEPFNSDPLTQIGTVPQVFTVVSPFDSIYRIGFFQRTNLKSFKPLPPPSDYGLDAASMKDFVLTKFSNGMDMAFKCPPLVRLKQIPRISALQSLGEKCAKFEKEREEQLKKKLIVDIKGKEEVIINTVVNTVSAETIKGTLVVEILSGDGLAPRDSNGLSDPYCLIALQDATERTSTKKKTLSPVWNQSFQFTLDHPATENLIITCMDWDAFSDDDYMGSVTIPLSACIKDYQNETFVSLLNIENEPLPVTGGITIRLEYFKSDSLLM